MRCFLFLLFFSTPIFAEAIRISSPREMIQAIHLDAKQPSEVVAFFDLDLYLGAYENAFISEFFFKTHYVAAGMRSKENQHDLVKEFKQRGFYLPQVEVTDARLTALIFSYLRQGEKFLLGDQGIIEDLKLLKNRGVDLKILTSRFSGPHGHLTISDLKSSGLDQIFHIDDVLFVGHERKHIVAERYMKKNNKSFIYFGDDIVDHIEPFYKEAAFAGKFKGFHLHACDVFFKRFHSEFENQINTLVKAGVDPHHYRFLIELFTKERPRLEAQGYSWESLIVDFYKVHRVS